MPDIHEIADLPVAANLEEGKVIVEDAARMAPMEEPEEFNRPEFESPADPGDSP